MRSFVFFFGFLVAGVAYAQNPTLTYRDSDPFLFCTEGQDYREKPERCWWPMPNYTGAWFPAPWCKPYNPYGRAWDQDDIRSLQQYLSVCPIAMNSGGWDGKDGPANMVPNKH